MNPASFDSPFLPLKARVSTRLRAEWRSALPEALIYRAINEAESAARTTGFPHLFFPELAAEKVRAVHLAVTSDFSHRVAA
jgi:hypothetical protein